MKFATGVALHQEVIHSPNQLGHRGRCEGVPQEFPLKDIQGKYDPKCSVCQEERFINKLSYPTLQSVCSDCFGIAE